MKQLEAIGLGSSQVQGATARLRSPCGLSARNGTSDLKSEQVHLIIHIIQVQIMRDAGGGGCVGERWERRRKREN